MAPIHHHFEHLGWSEPTVVIRFWIISFILALAGLVDAQAEVITARAFAGKHYAVLGLARSGLATVEALLASGAKVTAWDDKEEARQAPPGERAGSRRRAAPTAVPLRQLRWSPSPCRGGLRSPTSSGRPLPIRLHRRHPRPAAQPPPDRRARRARLASRSSATSSCSPAPGPSFRRTRWSGSPAPTASRPPPRWSTTSSRPRACRA